MRSLIRRHGIKTALVALLTMSLTATQVLAGGPVLLTDFRGAIDLSADGPTPYVLRGTTSDIGAFRARGEVFFRPGPGGSLIGQGPIVLEDTHGDLLVGIASWKINPGSTDLRDVRMIISWRDSVTLSDGTEVSNTGRFLVARPAGLVVIAIIAILIGLLLPAVQKVR